MRFYVEVRTSPIQLRVERVGVGDGGDDVDEISQNTRGMERSGNFWLSCDIKEAWIARTELAHRL